MAWTDFIYLDPNVRALSQFIDSRADKQTFGADANSILKDPTYQPDYTKYNNPETQAAAIQHFDSLRKNLFDQQARPVTSELDKFRLDPAYQTPEAVAGLAQEFGNADRGQATNPIIAKAVNDFQGGNQNLLDTFRVTGDMPTARLMQNKELANNYRDVTQGGQNIQATLSSKQTSAQIADKLAREKAAMEYYNNTPVTTDPASLEQFKTGVRTAAGTADVAEPILKDFIARNDPYRELSESQLTLKAINGDPKAQEVLDRMQGRKVQTALASRPPAAPRPGRMYSVLDTANGNMPIMMSAEELAASPRGQYISAGEGGKALNKTALIEDMRGVTADTRAALANMPEFSSKQAAQFSVALNDRNPETAMRSFITSKLGTALDPQQQTYLIKLAQLHENAMALRPVLGAGQGSDDVRRAIRATIPSSATPTKKYAAEQLDAFEKTLNRLSRGVPQVKLRDVSGGEPSGGGVDLQSAAAAELARRGGR